MPKLCEDPRAVPMPAPRFHSRDGATYARKLEATVTALGVRSPLLDVKKPGLATGGLDRPGVVRGGVPAAESRLAFSPASAPTAKLPPRTVADAEFNQLTRCGGGRSLFGEPLCLMWWLAVAGDDYTGRD